MNYLMIVISSVGVYLFMIFALRFFGKKELAQLSIADFVFILLISSAVQNALVAEDNTILGAFISAITLFASNFIFKLIMYKSPRFSRFVQGIPVILVCDGEVLKKNVEENKISIYEIEQTAREHEIEKIADIKFAILEVDGNISIIGRDSESGKPKKKKRTYKEIV